MMNAPDQNTDPAPGLTEPPAPYPAPSSPEIQCEKNTIMVVDDEPTIRMVFEQIINYGLPGCKVHLAENGEVGVAVFKEFHPAVILMDLHMPVMTGDRAFAEIRDFCKEENIVMPAIVFCTGYDPPHDVKNLVAENPAHCVLRKPISNDTLVEALRIRLRH